MAAFARTELDLVGDGAPGRPGRGAAVRRPQRQDARPGRVLPRCATTTPPTTRCSASSSPVLRPGHEHPARDARPALGHRHRGPRGVPGCPAGEHGPPPDPPAGREARAHGPRRPQRRRVARPRGRALAGRRGQDAGRARGAGRGAGPAGSADADRVLRHLQLPGRPVGRQHGRVRGGQAADGGVPPLPDQDRAGPERLRQPPGGPPSPLPRREGGRGGDRGGAPLGDAGPRHRRWRPGPGERGQGGPRRAGTRRPPAGRPGQGARGAVPARIATRPGRAAGHLAGALPRPAAARRGPPVRDHLPPRTCATGRRSSRRSTTCPASGPKRKRELLKVFGSAKRVREAPVEQIAAVPGIGRALAERIKAHLEA